MTNFDTYDIYYSSDATTYTYYGSSSSATPSISNLNANARYYFKLVPRSAVSGLSGDTYTFSGTAATTLPLLTTQSIYSIDASNQLTVQWDGSYNKAVVAYSTDGTTYTPYGEYTTPTKTASVSGLTPNTQYYFKITPRNTADVSGSAVYVTDTSAVTLGYLSSLKSTGHTTNTITLSYSGIYEKLLIYYGTYSGSTEYNTTISNSSTSTSNTNTTTIQSLNTGNTYYFTMYPYNKYGYYGTTLITSNNTVGDLSSNWTSSYSNIFVYYKFDDTTSIIYDFKGSYNTTATNCVVNVSGKVNNCINFNSAGYITLSSSVLNNLTTYSILFWVYLNSYGSYIITSKQHDTVNTYAVLSIGCYANSGGNIITGTSGYVYYHPSNNKTIAVSGSAISLNTWTHIAVTCSTSECKIYLNGSLSSTTSVDCTISNDTSSSVKSYIGYWLNSGAQNGSFIDGYMDDFAVFNTTLSASDISTIYNYQA